MMCTCATPIVLGFDRCSRTPSKTHSRLGQEWGQDVELRCQGARVAINKIDQNSLQLPKSQMY